MKFKMEIDCDNSAFDDPEEVSRILRKLADRICGKREDAGRVLDFNGNSVGTFELKEK
jgi:hypothetical protein